MSYLKELDDKRISASLKKQQNVQEEILETLKDILSLLKQIDTAKSSEETKK